MKIYEVQQNDFYISTDKSKLDIEIIHDYLCNKSYWAKNIPVETVQKSIEGSCCFGLYVTENLISNQIGFARVITDCATFGYLADFFILESNRGKVSQNARPYRTVRSGGADENNYELP